LAAAIVVVTGVIVGIVVAVVLPGGRAPIRPFCLVVAPSGRYQLSLDQAANAATIAAVGKSEGMPDHAVTVALAAALQESKLVNVPGGDRDSVGLFQQRPSQGWGTPEQLLTPQYAATAFYRALRSVPDWTGLSVAAAAQAVQRSADGAAYEGWEPTARAMAEALTGEVAGGLACQFDQTGSPPPATSLAAAMHQELGSSAFSSSDSAHQWLIAQWLVAHAAAYHITSVAFANWRWSPSQAVWKTSTSRRLSLAITVRGRSHLLTSADAVR
jgi:hypothetical protein